MSRLRLSLIAAALVLFPLVAQAQILRVVEEAPRAMERPAGAPATLGEALKAFRSTVHSEVIFGEIHDDAFVIPISGNAPGSNGTFFRSDLTIANYRATSQVVGIGFMAAGVDNTNAPLTYLTISANTSTAYNDFVGSQLNKTGLGAILVFGFTAVSGSTDSSAELDGFSRIWTPCPTTACPAGGTVSQTFDAVDLHDSLGSLTAYVLGLKQSSDYRTNVGIVNFDNVQHTWTIRSLFTGAVTTITVPPISVVQSGVAAGSGSALGNLALTLNSDGFGFYWSAYGTSVDNKTGDGWVSRAKQ